MKGPQPSYRVDGGRQAARQNTIIKKVGRWRQGPKQSHTRSKDEGERQAMLMNILVTEKNTSPSFFFPSQYTFRFCVISFTSPLLCVLFNLLYLRLTVFLRTLTLYSLVCVWTSSGRQSSQRLLEVLHLQLIPTH